jgi:large subunit ribosomal protein L15
MNLNEILSTAGAHRRRLRVGRGNGSGVGKTCGRGQKGAGSRAGARRRWGDEGGQNPILKRIPKRGFNNFNFRVEYQVVNLCDLEVFDDGAFVTVEMLAGKKLIRAGKGPVKVLGDGKLTKKLTVAAAAFSATAVEKIQAAGGRVEIG